MPQLVPLTIGCEPISQIPIPTPPTSGGHQQQEQSSKLPTNSGVGSISVHSQLVFLDKLKRRAFLRNWESSILQQNGE